MAEHGLMDLKDDETRLRTHFKRLSLDELSAILRDRSHEYTRLALSIVEEEMTRRGQSRARIQSFATENDPPGGLTVRGPDPPVHARLDACTIGREKVVCKSLREKE